MTCCGTKTWAAKCDHAMADYEFWQYVEVPADWTEQQVREHLMSHGYVVYEVEEDYEA